MEPKKRKLFNSLSVVWRREQLCRVVHFCPATLQMFGGKKKKKNIALNNRKLEDFKVSNSRNIRSIAIGAQRAICIPVHVNTFTRNVGCVFGRVVLHSRVGEVWHQRKFLSSQTSWPSLTNDRFEASDMATAGAKKSHLFRKKVHIFILHFSRVLHRRVMLQISNTFSWGHG